jgi:hypothetical protein
MKKISACLAGVMCMVCVSITAQTPDHSYTDCDGTTESIYALLAQGRPLLIASAGYDCSICMGEAGAVRDFAAQHPQVRVWGAMNYKYSGAVPECPAFYNWRTAYWWDNIFMFNDVDDDWQDVGYPAYYVISPADSLIVYQGANLNAAQAAALALVATSAPRAAAGIFKVSCSGRQLLLSGWPGICKDFCKMKLITPDGKPVAVNEFPASPAAEISFMLPEAMAPGVYFLQIMEGSRLRYASKIFVKP